MPGVKKICPVQCNRDTINTDTIDRILSAIERKKAEELHWHKSCYAKYTGKQIKKNNFLIL